MTDQLEALKQLRVPFPPEQIGKLPKGGVQLDFVGHGFLTARLLDVDPLWTWQPVAFAPNGLPLLDESGGLWIQLTVCGVTRYGYGDAGGRTGPNAVKEAIGDALRNAAMRFGVALELWCKGDPDAAPPKSGADRARDDLLMVCKRKRIAPVDIGARFLEDIGVSIYDADEETIRTFTRTLRDEKNTTE